MVWKCFCQLKNIRRFDSEYATLYAEKYAQALKHQHKRALVLTARKLVRLMYALLTKNVPYTVRPQTPKPSTGGALLA